MRGRLGEEVGEMAGCRGSHGEGSNYSYGPEGAGA